MLEVIIVSILGLCAGSFVNALVWRMHEAKNWINGRSECTHCHKQLLPKDLIPILSWLWLKGKCRYCHKNISVQYPLVELLVGLLYLGSYLLWPVSLSGLHLVVFYLWLVEITGLVALAIYDLKWMILPTKVIYTLGVIALLIVSFTCLDSTNPISTLVSYIEGGLIGGGIFYLIFLVSNGKWIGGGDVRLGFLLGILAGTASKSIIIIFIASFVGAITSIFLMLLHIVKRKTLIPYGPFLILAAYIIQLFGTDLVHWYSRVLLRSG